MKIHEIVSYLETVIPIGLQDDYDNAGFLVGNLDAKISGILLTIDVTEAVIDEAVKKECNLIVSHHPVIFGGVKKLTGKNYTEKILIAAIKNDIAIFSAHTNLDNMQEGVSFKMADKIGLTKVKVLSTRENHLVKLVTFVPTEHSEKVRNAMFNHGAGSIGNYDSCSYNLEGRGSFRGMENTNPFVGERGKVHYEPEVRIETIVPKHLLRDVLKVLQETHPYEEVAYDIYPLKNAYEKAGAGAIGELTEEMDEATFLKHLKKTFQSPVIRHTRLLDRSIKKVAICGGAGSFLVKNALVAGADIFVSGDFKYHQFFDAEDKIIIADIGHFESEQFTTEIFYELLTKKFSNFAINFSEVNTNPINYL